MQFQRRPWSHDARSDNFKTSLFFGAITTFPDTLGKSRKKAEDQGNTLRCAAFAAAMNGQYIHNEPMSTDWQTDKIGRVQGRPVDGYGSDPNAAMKSQLYQTRGGYLPTGDWNPTDPNTLDQIAMNYSDDAYLKPDGGIDYFDSIRSALQRTYNPQTKLGACVQAFSGWYTGWDTATIPTTIGTLLGYHSYLFVDFETVSGVPYLVLQNSYGSSWGDGGYQYMPREVVNREFSRFGTSLKIPSPLTQEQIKLAKEESPLGMIQRTIINMWFRLVLLLYGSIRRVTSFGGE